jgi:mannan endo-1,4-beta-mannosidase
MHVANDLGLTVIRTWAFMNADGGGSNTGALDQRLLQPRAGVYKASEFVHLDYVLATANAHNVRLILSLGNNWKEYGGIDQYLQWCKPGGTAVDFYRDPACVGLYKAYVAHVLGRKNTVNGRIYGEDPTVFAWELMNEPRCKGCPPTVVHDWLVQMARFVKHEAIIKQDAAGAPVRGAAQMVTTGEEGFDCTYYKDARVVGHAYGYQDLGNVQLHPWMYDGSEGMCYGQNTRIADIDFGSFHIYPDDWQFKDGVRSEASWIRDHVLIAKAGQQTPEGDGRWADRWRSWGPALAKPAVLGEFGSGPADRPGRFDAWLKAIEADEPFDPPGKQGDGALVWQLTCPLCQNHAGSFDVLFPPVTGESTLVCTHANRVSRTAASCQPTHPYAPP